MAAALCVTVIADGAFGEAVADALAMLRPAASLRHARLDDRAGLAGADAAVLACWRPEPELADRVDGLAFANGTPWLPVVMEHPCLRVGPLVLPPAGPCHACFAARRRQHRANPQLDRALHEHYRQDAEAGPPGFLPPLAVLAAAAAADALDDPAAAAGRFRQLDVVSMAGGSGHVVGVDGCPRCGSGPAERAQAHERFAGQLRAVLS